MRVNGLVGGGRSHGGELRIKGLHAFLVNKNESETPQSEVRVSMLVHEPRAALLPWKV